MADDDQYVRCEHCGDHTFIIHGNVYATVNTIESEVEQGDIMYLYPQGDEWASAVYCVNCGHRYHGDWEIAA